MSNKLQLRRDTAANWEAANPVLAQGEIGLILDDYGKVVGEKIGDGKTAWTALPKGVLQYVKVYKQPATPPLEGEGEGFVAKGDVGYTIEFGTFGKHLIYRIPAGSSVKITNLTGGKYYFSLCNSDNVIVESHNTSQLASYAFKVYQEDLILYCSKDKLIQITLEEKYQSMQEVVDDINEHLRTLSLLSSSCHWTGKKIWWCGTSIPAGSDATLGSDATIAGNYPSQVGTILGADIYNESTGGSMCRANVLTGDYNGANISNITSALTMTLDEIEEFITNYDTLKNLPKNSGKWPDSLSEQEIQRMREASFEIKLLPYLDGTKEFPDLFVIDHGHNDWKYNKADGTSDIDILPTPEAVGGELSEDTYMTSDNYANLAKFFGNLDDIPEAERSSFVASVNRNCYIGAVNFLITLILSKNPHARIVFITNYEYEDGANKGYAPLITAQEKLSKSWAFPLCEVYKYLGFSDHIIPNSKAWFNSTYPSATPATSDIKVFRAYNPDNVHPHFDITGDANSVYGGVIAEFIKTCR